MATIGTFFKNGDGYRGLISTATLQAQVTITRDHKRGPSAYILKAGKHTIGHAIAETSNTFTVQLHRAIAPGLDRAVLKSRDGCYVIIANNPKVKNN